MIIPAVIAVRHL